MALTLSLAFMLLISVESNQNVMCPFPSVYFCDWNRIRQRRLNRILRGPKLVKTGKVCLISGKNIYALE